MTNNNKTKQVKGFSNPLNFISESYQMLSIIKKFNVVQHLKVRRLKIN